jgi:membrane protein implicated in regulation of membrane protease activity
VWAWATLAAALVCAAMTALGVAVLTTSGGIIDQVAISTQDWLGALMFALLTGVLSWLAARRLGRLRRARRQHGGLE